MRWVDISPNEGMPAYYELRSEAAMARFHTLDANGDWQTGAWRFAELWSHLPAYRWLAQLLQALRLLPVLDQVYKRLARWRPHHSCQHGNC